MKTNISVRQYILPDMLFYPNEVPAIATRFFDRVSIATSNAVSANPVSIDTELFVANHAGTAAFVFAV